MATVVSGNTIKLNNGQTVQGQDNGWYDGQNFSGGQLGGAGVKISAGPGQGQKVSNEVVAQTNPNNVAYLKNLNDVQNHLNGVQNSTFSNYSGGDIPGVQSASEIKADLQGSGMLPTNTAPTAPDLVGTYQNLTSQAGVTGLQQDITDLKSQQDAIAGQALVSKQAEQNKPVAENVIQGRVSTEQQQAQDQYDFIGRQLSRKTDELNSALTNIKAIMDFTQQDYSNAETSYNDQFQQAIATINLVHGIQQDQKTDAQRAIDNARANLQIYTTAITNGNLDPNNLAPDQQAQLNKLEVQSGLPVGFVQSLQMDPSKSLLYSGKTDNGQIQVLIRNQDGSISSSLYGSATAPGSSKADIQNAQSNATTDNAKADAKRGATLQQLVDHYGVAGGLSTAQVYSIYNSNSPRGKAHETLKDTQQGNYSTQKNWQSLG